MDIIRFTDPEPLRLRNGLIINGITSKMWIERYREAGEFELKGPVSAGLREALPLGAIISHAESQEPMIVEDHQISEDKDRESEVVITGRGFETYLDNRIVGSNKTFPTEVSWEFVMPADYTWDQAVLLINHHILAARLKDPDDAIPFLQVQPFVWHQEGQTHTHEARGINAGPLHKRLLELLELDDIGFRIIRPSPTSPLGPTTNNMLAYVHNGTDRRKSVSFSYDSGEVDQADYLWSNRKVKNAAFIRSKWLETRVIKPGVTRFNRRYMHLDASDLDNHINEMPTQPIYGDIINTMRQRADKLLAAQREVVLAKAQISKTQTQHEYRRDFFIGDVVTVNGNYNTASGMRVVEFVEIEDETGEFGYPTLTLF